MSDLVCEFCGHEFKRASSRMAHLCEPGRRHKQRNEPGVQIGFRSYQRYFAITSPSSKPKTYEEFSRSPFYLGFVRFGRYAIDIRITNVESYLDWLVKKSIKIDYWTKDANYNNWMLDFLPREPAVDAISRSLNEMQRVIDENGGQYAIHEFFRRANPFHICQLIMDGRLSPWVLYNCGSGKSFLGTLQRQQLGKIMRWIDPLVWKPVFESNPHDTELIATVLGEAGL